MIFLKLGGSLITKKDEPFTVNWTVMEAVAAGASKIDEALLVGHGGGSFGHFVAKEYEGYIEGFFKTRGAMAKLNNIVVSSLIAKGVYAVGFPPSSFMVCKGGEVDEFHPESVIASKEHYVPVLHGDAILDREMGYVIYSTERIFREMAKHIKPRRVLLATDSAVLMDGEPVEKVGDWNIQDVLEATSGGGANEVTGGMKEKVREAAIISAETESPVFIFDGSKEDAIKRAWKFGEGTRVEVTKSL